jgi:hypothetical protein
VKASFVKDRHGDWNHRIGGDLTWQCKSSQDKIDALDFEINSCEMHFFLSVRWHASKSSRLTGSTLALQALEMQFAIGCRNSNP